MAENQESNEGSNAVASGNNADKSVAGESGEKRKKTVEKKRPKHVHVCEVRLLDGTELVIEVEKNADGEVLFSKVVENLDIIDKEYFGLRFTRGSEPTKCWLVLQKPIRKQLNIGELKFQFAVKFYEPEPGKHLDEYTRYLLYLQLREDIVYGRLGCPARTYILLASFTAQAEFGDYNASDHGVSYLDGYQLGPEEVENDPKFMSKVIELHKEHSGQTPAEAELNFLEVAKRTPRYGVDIHYAKNKKDDIEVGVSYKGVFVYQDGEPLDSYGWKAIDLVAYKRKKFMLKLFRSEKRKNPRFRLKGRRESKNLYKSAIEHHAFFRLTNSDRRKRRSGSFIGSKFRYSDRTLYQIRSDPSVHDRQRELKFARAPSKRQKVKSRRERKPDTNDAREVEAKVPDNLASEVKKPNEDYEEIELDQPYDDRYEWVIVEKVLPDGTKKEYRRRIISTTATTVTETTYVIRKGTEEEGHMMEEKPIETPKKDEVTLVREKMKSPEISEKEELKIDESSKNRQEVIVTTIITEEAITKPEVGDEVEEPMSLAELKAASKKPSAAVKPLMRDDIEQDAKSKVSETTTTTTTTTKKVLVYDVDKEETIKIVSKEERERELREREKQREIEEEQRRQDEIRARNEREAATRRKWKEQEEERKRKEEERKEKEEEEEKIRREKAMSPELQEISLSTGNEEFDKEFGIKGMDTFLIKTSPMPSSFMKDLEEELSHSLVDDDDVDAADGSLNVENVAQEEKKEYTLDVPVIEEPRKAKTLDRKFIRRPPPERSSGYIRRSYGNELDFDYSYGSRTMPRKPRKYVPLITKEELVRAYSSGGLHDESIIRSKQEPEEDKSKIEYSLKDESGVEQGQQGFVKNLIGRHETIKLKEDEEVEEQRRSRVYSSSDDVKLFVPTRTASFGNVEKPETKKTKVPPPVKTKPVVFAADRSGLSAVVVTRPASAIELSSPVVAEANINEAGQPANPTEIRKYSIPEVTTSTVVFDSSVPIDKKTTSGLIDKSSVEPLWGKVVLKQRRSFKGSDSFDVTSSFELLTMKEQGLIPENHGSKSRELFITNFAEPEVILDEKSRIKQHDTELGFTKDEYEADESEDVNRLVLNDLTPEKTPKPMFVCNELDEWSVNNYIELDEWSPSDYIDKSKTNDASQVVVVEENSLETNLVDEIFCDFEKFEEVDAVGSQLSSEITNYISSDISKKITGELSNEVSVTYDDSISCEADVALDSNCESHDVSCDQDSSEHLGFIGNQNDQREASVENCVGHVTTKNEGDGKNNENDLVSGGSEKATKVENNVSENVFDNSHQVNEECVGKCNNIDDKNGDENYDENIDNDSGEGLCQKEIVENNVLENKSGRALKDKVDVKEADLTAREGDGENEVGLHGGDTAEEVEVGNEGGNVFLGKSDAAEEVEMKKKPIDGIEDNKSLNCENRFDEKVEGLDVDVKEVNTDRNEINDETCPDEEARYFHRHERIRFDSCPDLGVYNDSNFDDVFSSGRSFKRAATMKEKKSKNSYTKLKKQAQRRKPASDSNQLAISKRLSFSLNSELGRLKKEYDASLAAFRRQRSKSLDDVIVATQTIAVSPVDQAEPTDVTGSPIVTPPPPDVINHSDSILTSSPDVTDDAFPSPPPDVITQTMAISPAATSGTTTTTIVTEEIVHSHQNPPEVETRTVILSGDGISKEDFERMISSESVTTSETTVSKTIKTEVTTVSSGQRIIITGEGEVSEDLQQALANAAVGNGE